MTSVPTADPAGTVLEGRYRVDGLLARGGMSVVHRGSDLRLDRPVAIKILDRGLAADPAFVRRFEREARAAARLAHPGVVAVHDVHVWAITSGAPVFTAHVVVDAGVFRSGATGELLDELSGCLAKHFDVEHSTFQLEPAEHAAHEDEFHR